MNNIVREFSREVGKAKNKQRYLEIECNECGAHYETAKNDHKRAKYPFYCRACVMRIKAQASDGGRKTLSYDSGELIPMSKERDRLLVIWHGMNRRCTKPTQRMYHRYGGRGIKVEFKSFGEFHDWALSNGYADDLTIDRENSDLNYSADNCHWATKLEQAQDRHVANRSKYLLGVRPSRERFSSRIRYNNKEHHCGTFDTQEEAHQAYLDKKAELVGN